MLDTLERYFIELDEDKVKITIQRLFKAGFDRNQVIAVLNRGLDVIGKKYETGEYTLSDLMMAGILYEDLMHMDCFDLSNTVDPLASPNKILLLGTIESDMHDIGKSLFKTVASSCGFEVVDLGIDVKPEAFCDKIEAIHPDILGISIILTGAIPYLRETVKMIEKRGLRDQIKIIIGGSIADEQLCRDIGADGYTNDAAEGVEICQKWIE